MGESALGKTLTFRRGVHPHEGIGEKRATGAKPIEAVPRAGAGGNSAAPARGRALQAAGQAGRACISGAEDRRAGRLRQRRGALRRFRARVKGIQPRIIAGGAARGRGDPRKRRPDEWDPSLAPLSEDAGAEKLLEAVREAGIVGPGRGDVPHPRQTLAAPRTSPLTRSSSTARSANPSSAPTTA